MAGTPDVSQETHDGLTQLAVKHSRIETFHQDVLRLADTVWHNVRRNGAPVEEEGSTEESETPAESQEPADSDKTKKTAASSK
jgi:hypothetical protein